MRSSSLHQRLIGFVAAALGVGSSAPSLGLTAQRRIPGATCRGDARAPAPPAAPAPAPTAPKDGT